MSNMSYCRFESTYNDLRDCEGALDDEGGIAGVEKDANGYEKKYIRKLVKLCREIAENYGDEADEE